MTEQPGLVGLHHVQLAAPRGSEDVLRRFYAGVLGMTEVSKPPDLVGRGGVWFRAGGVELHLGVEDDFRPARKAHPALVVADLDALAGKLRAARIVVSFDDAISDVRRFYANDPVGNRLEFIEDRVS